MLSFENKVVIVTGAGSGIGAATATLFSQRGASVVLSGRTEKKLKAVAEKLDPARTLTHVADVADPASVDQLIAATLKKFGKLDVLVNNAGVGVMKSITDTTLDDWRKTIETDVSGVFYCSRAAVPYLLKTKGSIVNVSSVSGLGGDWGMAAYNAAKGAVTNFTRSLALELGDRGVRVNAVNPSLTFTDMTGDMKNNKPLMAKFRERIPMGRGAEPEDIAPAILFLAGEDARFVTGVNLPVDGGLNASNGQPKIG